MNLFRWVIGSIALERQFEKLKGVSYVIGQGFVASIFSYRYDWQIIDFFIFKVQGIAKTANVYAYKSTNR